MITQTFDLNLIPGGVLPIVKVSQYDKVSRTLEITLYEGPQAFEIPTGATITIQGTKPDNTGFQYACTWSGSVVSVDVEQQMTAVYGNVPCELVIAYNNEILGTGNFTLQVEKAALGDDTVISDTDLPLIQQAIQAEVNAKNWAVGPSGSGVDEPSDTNNAYYWAMQAAQNSGHIIVDPDGTSMDARANLKFAGDVTVTDDSVNDMTIVTVNAPDAEDISYSNSTSGLAATDVQDAVDELASEKQDTLTAGANIQINGSTISATDTTSASGITYNNSTSGLAATDVQTAVDELASEKQDTLTAGTNIQINGSTISATDTTAASGITYDNTNSGLAATDVQDAIDEIASGGGGGGHVIEDTDGTDMTQRANLQFVGVYTADDSGNNRTEVNITREMTDASYQALTSDEKAGIIRATDTNVTYINGNAISASVNASGITYDNTNSGLAASDVQSAIDEVVAEKSLHIECGTDTFDNGGKTITFNNAFTNPPVVVATEISANGLVTIPKITNGTTTSFTINLWYNGSSVNGAVNWIAYGT